MPDTTPSLDDLMAQTNRLLQQDWNGVSIGALFGGLGVLILALLVRSVMARAMVEGVVNLFSGEQKSGLDAKTIRRIAAPLRLLPVVIGLYIAREIIDPPESIRVIADQILRTIIILSLFWSLSRAAILLTLAFKSVERMMSSAMAAWVVQAIRVLLLAVGLAAALEVWGVRVAPLLAGLGLFGVAVALGAQDLFKNLIAGAVILFERRFDPGDWILAEGVVEGTVETVGFRSTIVRKFDKGPVYVPNSMLADRPVINYSRMTHRRIRWTVALDYSTTKDQLRAICRDVTTFLEADAAFAPADEAPLYVTVDKFGESSVDLILCAFTRSIAMSDWLAAKEALALEIKRIVHAHGTDFAFPSRRIYVTQQGQGPDSFGLEGEVAEPFPQDD
jgi:MscS family membrane protein